MDNITYLSSLVSLLGIWILVFWLFRSYNIDSFRQRMFGLRDELFDFAADGHISFDHPAYGILRRSMNGMIRFGHKLSLFNVMLTMLMNAVSQSSVISFEKKWEESIKGLDPDIKDRLMQYRQRMNILVLRHMITGSPLLVVTVFPLVFGMVSLKLCVGNLLAWLKDPLDFLDSEALVLGEL